MNKYIKEGFDNELEKVSGFFYVQSKTMKGPRLNMTDESRKAMQTRSKIRHGISGTITGGTGGFLGAALTDALLAKIKSGKFKGNKKLMALGGLLGTILGAAPVVALRGSNKKFIDEASSATPSVTHYYNYGKSGEERLQKAMGKRLAKYMTSGGKKISGFEASDKALQMLFKKIDVPANHIRNA